MRIQKKTILLAAVIPLLAACTLDYPTNGPAVYEETRDYAVDEQTNVDMALYEETPSSTSQDVPPEDQTIIRTARVEYESVTYKDSKEQLYTLLEDHEAMIQYQSEYSTQYNDTPLTEMDMVIRVPQEKFDETIKSLESAEFANLVELSMGLEDVTKQVFDLDLRIDSINQRIERLNEMNEEATTMEDMIALETALNEAMTQRDQLLAQKEGITDQAEMSTINLRLREVLRLSDDSESQYTFWEQVVQAFQETWRQSGVALQQAVVTIIYLIPFVLFLGIVLAFLAWVARPILKWFASKRRRQRKLKKGKIIADASKKDKDTTVKHSNESVGITDTHTDKKHQ